MRPHIDLPAYAAGAAAIVAGAVTRSPGWVLAAFAIGFLIGLLVGIRVKRARSQ